MMKKTYNSVIRTRSVAVLGIVLIVWTSPAWADLIAFTSFEEPGVFSGNYVDTGDPLVDHVLADNPGEPLVNWIKTGPELGFSSFYTNTRGNVGLTDGDLVGVTDSVTDVTAYAHGDQGFRISDADGLMTTTLDAVSLGGYLNPIVSSEVFVAETGWESDDRIRVWATVDGGSEIDLLNTAGQDIDDLTLEGQWTHVYADLSGFTTATLAFEFDSNAGTEFAYFDNVQFDGTVVPIPSSLVLGGLGISLAVWMRRRWTL